MRKQMKKKPLKGGSGNKNRVKMEEKSDMIQTSKIVAVGCVRCGLPGGVISRAVNLENFLTPDACNMKNRTIFQSMH